MEHCDIGSQLFFKVCDTRTIGKFPFLCLGPSAESGALDLHFTEWDKFIDSYCKVV